MIIINTIIIIIIITSTTSSSTTTTTTIKQTSRSLILLLSSILILFITWFLLFIFFLPLFELKVNISKKWKTKQHRKIIRFTHCQKISSFNFSKFGGKTKKNKQFLFQYCRCWFLCNYYSIAEQRKVLN